jgi:hypothetical protein
VDTVLSIGNGAQVMELAASEVELRRHRTI